MRPRARQPPRDILNIVTLDKPLKSSERKKPITTIVLHSTAGKSATSSIAWMRVPGVMASYHYIIERNGTIYKCVPTGRKAWHAGKSIGPGGKDVNQYSIGISFANRNDGIEEITTAQLKAATSLVDALKTAYPTIEWITTHRLVSWGRKTDPREFDFLSFSKGLPQPLKAWRDKPQHPWND